MGWLARALTDGEILEVGGAVVRLRVSGKARRVSIRLDRRAGEFIAVAPTLRRLAEAAAFARARADWIAARLAELPDRQAIAPDMAIAVFGETVRLEAGAGRARWIAAGEDQSARITAMGEGEGYARAVVRQIRKRALMVMTERTLVHAERLQAAAPQVAVTDTRSRWGSCTPARSGGLATIRYSWRLALAPFAVADYVAAHECAHLRELNHGPRFWAHVEALVGDPRPHRAWLRAEGARLHAFGADQTLTGSGGIT